MVDAIFSCRFTMISLRCCDSWPGCSYPQRDTSIRRLLAIKFALCVQLQRSIHAEGIERAALRNLVEVGRLGHRSRTDGAVLVFEIETRSHRQTDPALPQAAPKIKAAQTSLNLWTFMC
eukprot:TRINITY_DN4392_c0_g1_i4.p1 TRINITY_DN4392_c0_g1~~TRINITY_DN4392_c0_g1_i4.p1  ORF type:complete len:119 (-),score=13.13 TRINITY_DN4392_c0_g1_i4:112-468(-)